MEGCESADDFSEGTEDFIELPAITKRRSIVENSNDMGSSPPPRMNRSASQSSPPKMSRSISQSSPPESSGNAQTSTPPSKVNSRDGLITRPS